MTRDEFMEFFRDTEKLNTLSVEDRLEIFESILPGSSDITPELLNRLLDNYDVNLPRFKTYSTIQAEIRWLDDQTTQVVTFGIGDSPDLDDDDNIFFWLDTVEELEDFKKPGIEDWIVIEVLN